MTDAASPNDGLSENLRIPPRAVGWLRAAL
jgi:hypothetical protein